MQRFLCDGRAKEGVWESQSWELPPPPIEPMSWPLLLSSAKERVKFRHGGGKGLHLGDGAVMGKKYDIYYLRFTSPQPRTLLFFSFISLFHSCGTFLTALLIFSL